MVFSSRGFPLHSEWDSLQGIPLVNSEWNSHHCVTLSKRMGFAPRGSPSTKRLGFAPKGLPLQANGIRIKRVALSKANGIRFQRRASLQQETPFKGFFSEAALLKGFPFPKGFAYASKRMVFASRDFHSPKRQRLSRGSQILLGDAFIPSFVS